MDDITEKISEILNSPEKMAQLSSIMEQFTKGAEDSKPTPPSFDDDQASLLDGIDMNSMMKILSALKQNNNTKETHLLHALRPLLSEPRRYKVDEAIKIMKLVGLLPLVKELGIFGGI